MYKTLVRLNLLKIFLLAILLRLLIMPFYFHQDIKTYNYQASFLKKGVVNIYSYLVNNKESLPLKEEFVYFPLTYFFLGINQLIAAPLLGSGFQNWLADASSGALNQTGVFRYIFILKLPYLILDLLIPFLLIEFLKNDSQKRQAFIFWLFNPFSLALIYIFSNVDIIPVALSMLSLLLFQRKKFTLSAIILGLAIGFKPYPLISLPFLLSYIRDFKKAAIMLATVLVTAGAVITPFLSTAFFHSALLSNLTTRLAYPGIAIGFGEGLMIGVVLLSILFFAGLLNNSLKIEYTWQYLLAVFLIVLSSIHFHIQWLLWIMPFIVMFQIFNKELSVLTWLWILLAFFIPLLYDDKSMTVSLLSVNSSLYNILPTPFSVFQHIYDPYLMQGIIQSLIFGIAALLVWKIFRSFNI